MYIENIEELKELIELFGVVEAKSENVVAFGEVESLDSFTEENAKKALDILNKHKQENKKRYRDFFELKEWINGDEERKQIFADIAICERCNKIVANSEMLTSFPILAKYDENRSVFEQLETVAICPDCLMFITRVYESLFDFEG